MEAFDTVESTPSNSGAHSADPAPFHAVESTPSNSGALTVQLTAALTPFNGMEGKEGSCPRHCGNPGAAPYPST